MNLRIDQDNLITQRQNQSFTYNSKMQQKLQVLKLPIYELYGYMKEQMYDNPFLELDSAEEMGNDTVNSLTEEDNIDDLSIQFFNDPVYYTRKPNHIPVIHSNYVAYGQEIDFFAMLREQINVSPLEPNLRHLCLYIIESLNSRGYLDNTIEDIAFETGMPLQSVEQALQFVQGLSPKGVGARNLGECLKLQLVHSKGYNQYTQRIIENGLTLLANNQIPKLSKLLQLPYEETEKYCEVIRSLNPIPSSGYSTGEKVGFVIPEATVKWSDGSIDIYMNYKKLPHLVISNDYKNEQLFSKNKDTKHYYETKMVEAKTVIKILQDRKSTVQRIITEIVNLQQKYFIDGTGLIPMKQSDIAAALDLHTSTVSRAIQDKFILCIAGIVSIKSLFSSPIQTLQKTVSSSEIKQKIKNIINTEDKKNPFSDESICSIMNSSGIKISRRTIAYYRDEMQIPGSSLRKRRK